MSSGRSDTPGGVPGSTPRGGASDTPPGGCRRLAFAGRIEAGQLVWLAEGDTRLRAERCPVCAGAGQRRHGGLTFECRTCHGLGYVAGAR